METALPRGLSMLWETSVDPARALRDRFGFADLEAAGRWVAGLLETRWDLSDARLERLVISDRAAICWVRAGAGAERLILKWSAREESFARLAGTARLLRVLAEQGLPVLAPVPARGGIPAADGGGIQVTRPAADGGRIEVAGPAGRLSVAVMPEAPGTWLDVADAAQVHEAGAVLARLHAALADAEAPWLEDAPEADGRQLVHGDFRAANILVRDGRISAVLDFDEVRRDHPVADLAQASVLLGTLFTGWAPAPAATARALREGYESVRPLAPAEAGRLEDLAARVRRTMFPDAPA